jgi:hypothetical protein
MTAAVPGWHPSVGQDARKRGRRSRPAARGGVPSGGQESEPEAESRQFSVDSWQYWQMLPYGRLASGCPERGRADRRACEERAARSMVRRTPQLGLGCPDQDR